jgi:hypothetical protein
MKRIKSITESMVFQPKTTRFETLTYTLEQYHIPYEVESCGDSCNNVIVSNTDASRYTLLVAHYDVYGSSLGINDNTVSVATLITIYQEMIKKCSLPFKILFADKEESGMIGSQHFAKKYKDNILVAIVLDIIGFGNTLIQGSKTLLDFHMLNDLGIKSIKTVMPSDNLAFQKESIKTTLITACFDEELKDIHGELDITYPWYFSTSFHNGIHDNDMKKINFELASQLLSIFIRLFEKGEHNHDITT